jgi:ferritin-like metal-binding protein YciE
MGLFTKDIQSMDDLLLHGLQDIYYAENQIVKSLPKLIDKATNRELTKGLSDHLEETKKQVGRLDQVFTKLGQQPKGVKCPAIDGLIAEADEVAGEDMARKRKRKRKYSRGAGREVEREMHRYKRGKAKSGRGGKGGKVKSRKQAIAIGLSKARKKGKKVPKKRS